MDLDVKKVAAMEIKLMVREINHLDVKYKGFGILDTSQKEINSLKEQDEQYQEKTDLSEDDIKLFISKLSVCEDPRVTRTLINRLTCIISSDNNFVRYTASKEFLSSLSSNENPIIISLIKSGFYTEYFNLLSTLFLSSGNLYIPAVEGLKSIINNIIPYIKGIALESLCLFAKSFVRENTAEGYDREKSLEYAKELVPLILDLKQNNEDNIYMSELVVSYVLCGVIKGDDFVNEKEAFYNYLYKCFEIVIEKSKDEILKEIALECIKKMMSFDTEKA